MTKPIEDYALIGDTRTAALVARDGSIDWMCLPRFDSGACFAAMLGDRHHGRWSLSPVAKVTRCSRRYRDRTLVLETELTTADGTVRIVDCMPPDEDTPHVVRVVEGVRGTVDMRMELIIRFDYGWIVPWVRRLPDGVFAVGGPDAVYLHTPVPTHGENLTTVAQFQVHEGERVPFVLTGLPSTAPVPTPIDALAAIEDAERWWHEWAGRCAYQGAWSDDVIRSQITLKALTYSPTGGIIAAATTSLPVHLGGERNWDYRYVWLRDATFTLYALMLGGYKDEAQAWRDWLLRAIAGDPSQLQVLYGVAGERRLPEQTLPWLPGYAGSKPVRIGNAAVSQLQLDVYGEVIDAIYHARRIGLPEDPTVSHLVRHMLDFLESNWRDPDEGLWEVRGPRQHFTHSKVMAWTAFDRAVKSSTLYNFEGPVDRWRAIRDEIHAEVCTRAFDPAQQSFTQAYDSTRLDASVLMLPQVGFLPWSDPRIHGTVAAIERGLVRDGFVDRYRTDGHDGLPDGEGAFLLCTFWLADAYALTGRVEEGRALFDKLLAIRNDVGLLAEEYCPIQRRMLGNFPQAFSHLGLINTAYNLHAQASPTQRAPAVEREAHNGRK